MTAPQFPGSAETDVETTAEVRRAHSSKRGWRKPNLRFPEETGVVLALVVIVALTALLAPTFRSTASLISVIRYSAFFGIIALGMVFLFSAGDVDLSVGSIFYLTAVVTARSIMGGVDPWLAALLAIVLGGVLGFVNGVISVTFRSAVLIITLGTILVYRGLGLVVSGAKDSVIQDTSTSFFTVTETNVFGVLPAPFVLFVILAVAAHVLLHRTRFGYRAQAIGSNLEAARLVGIPVTRTRLIGLAMTGALCGLVGAVFVGYFGAVDASVGQGFEFLVVSAVIIGGTPLTGGAGTIIGAVVGTLIIAVIQSAIVHFGVQAVFANIVTGSVIVVAIGIDALVRRRKAVR